MIDLKALSDAATRGPWDVDGRSIERADTDCHWLVALCDMNVDGDCESGEKNAAFIVALVNAWRAKELVEATTSKRHSEERLSALNQNARQAQMIAQLRRNLEAERAKAEKLAEALAFYENAENWRSEWPDDIDNAEADDLISAVEADGGNLARASLAEYRGAGE